MVPARWPALALRVIKRRMVRSPPRPFQQLRYRNLEAASLIFDTAPSFCLPPVDLCHGTRPRETAKSVRWPGRSILDPFIVHLEVRMAEGCKDSVALWREVQGRNYAYDRKAVQKRVAENRTRPARRTPWKWLQGLSASAAPSAASAPCPALPSPKQLARRLVRPATALSPLDVAGVRRAEQDKKAAQVASLARRFTALVRRCGAGQPTRPVAPAADLDAWLAEARMCGIGAVETFAAGLEHDSAGVRAALTEP